MTRLLIVAATLPEVKFLSGKLKNNATGKIITLESPANMQLDLLITGVGITATTYQLAKALSWNRYDLAVSIGICGSLDPAITPVRIVNITEDCFADFGAENGNEILDTFEMEMTGKNEKPFSNGKLFATWKKKLDCLDAIPRVKGITVQLVHGSDASAKKTFKRYGPVMESMEGAAFFYVCRLENIPCLQIRAVSNKVEKRNKKLWKINQAIEALAGFTGLLLLELNSRIQVNGLGK